MNLEHDLMSNIAKIKTGADSDGMKIDVMKTN